MKVRQTPREQYRRMLLVVFLVSICLSSSSAFPQNILNRIRPTKMIDGIYSLLKTEKLDSDRSLNFLYEGSNSFKLDVFVYPATVLKEDVATLSSLDREISRFTEVLPDLVKRSIYESAYPELIMPTYYKFRGMHIDGRKVIARFKRDDQLLRSYLFIYLVEGYFFKFRITVPLDALETSYVEKLVLEWLDTSIEYQIEPGTGSPYKPMQLLKINDLLVWEH